MTSSKRIARLLREADERIYDPATIDARLSGLSGQQRGTLWDIYRKGRAELTAAERQYSRVLVGLFKDTAVDLEGDLSRIFSELGQDTWDIASVRRAGRDKILLAQIRDRIRALGGKFNSTLDEAKLLQFNQAYANAGYLLDSMTPGTVDIRFNMLPDNEILALLDQPFAGAKFSERLGVINDEMAQTIKFDLLRSMMAEESWQDAARRIRTQMGTTGTRMVWRAEMIARTELARAQELANFQLYEDNADVIEKVVWVAHPGACDVCLDMHGEELDDPSEYPPEASHPNCLCDAMPVPKSYGPDFVPDPIPRGQWDE